MRRLGRLFCPHKHTIMRRIGRRMFVECLTCGHESKGVITGACNLDGIRFKDHTYSKETIEKLTKGKS